ncbi:MAG: glycosyltransferase family A protein [Cyclobacteriaceae bacterium]
MESFSKPLISIIIATYDASHLLKYAIKSALDSDYDNFELLVIGDCCTDDTEQCVASFEDSRIRFYNLEKNSGQQATPNNYGLKKAKGKYIAFLNQDDLFFPIIFLHAWPLSNSPSIRLYVFHI